jgi:hypothetical protein
LVYTGSRWVVISFYWLLAVTLLFDLAQIFGFVGLVLPLWLAVLV